MRIPLLVIIIGGIRYSEYLMSILMFDVSSSLFSVIIEGSEAAKDLSKADLAKRMRAYSEKKAKLAKSHYFVSRTRLCVRNLPTSVDEKKLKTLFLKHTGDPSAKIVQVRRCMIKSLPVGPSLIL